MGEIKRGAEEHLEVMRVEKQRLEMGSVLAGTVPKVVGHIEKVEETEDDVPEKKQATEKGKEVEDDTTTEEENVASGPRKRKTPSMAKAKQAALEAKIKEQKRRYEEATKWRRATKEALGDVDLEEAMEKMMEAETASTSTASTSRVWLPKCMLNCTQNLQKKAQQEASAERPWKENNRCNDKRKRKRD